MININKFDIKNLKGEMGNIRDWLKHHHIPPRLLFFILGIVSTIWFLIRVIPKPSRAGYPCMRVAAPFMSGMITYFLAVGGITLISRKMKRKIINVRYASATLLLLSFIGAMAVIPSENINTVFQNNPPKMGPDDGPNQPFGVAQGIFPGRVVWVWNPKATNPDQKNNYTRHLPHNTNQAIVSEMVQNSVKKTGGDENIKESWNAIFRYFNKKKNNRNVGYTKGEKIFIKINQTSINSYRAGQTNGYYLPETMTQSDNAKVGKTGTCETQPYVPLEIIRELVNVAGVDQKDIYIGDPMVHTYGYLCDIWRAEFPDIHIVDRSGSDFGRTLIKPTETEVLHFSDKTGGDKLFDVIENANYLINIANFKPHERNGITLTAKNHFGSQAQNNAMHLHYSLISPLVAGRPTNTGYHKYRVLVDIMGSKYLGQNTLLYIVDGLYAGGSNESRGSVKYFMAPFNNNWTNSLFMSLDQVALESVCFDFLRTEWDGTKIHEASNNKYEYIPNVNGVDDYLHQAADPANWPQGISYDPDNSGNPLTSLGIHEHWNNPIKKQYSRNLGFSSGIELISIPDTLVNNKPSSGITSQVSLNREPQGVVLNNQEIAESTETKGPFIIIEEPGSAEQNAIKSISVVNRSFEDGILAKKFYSAAVDDDNTKWFLTDAGIVSYDGKKWSLHNKNRKLPVESMKDLAYDFSSYGPELWIASPLGATVASLPVDARSGATTYYTENSTILSDNVLSVAVGKGSLRWFGTDKGISAFRNKKWLTYSYQRKYPEGLFKDFPITAMATSPDGDSLYVATKGAGVARVFRNKVDAISGASEYAQWGPIEMPSDSVYSICITPDGTQWFGTTMGAARHIGFNTLEKWTVFNKENGLVDNFVQAIACDAKGNLWFGTKGGVSVFDGTAWTSYSLKEGLSSNNILCITTDKKGVLWLGTDNGVISYNNGEFSNYR